MTSALVFVDGFDKYGPTGNQNVSSVILGEWTLTSGTPSIVAPLSSFGQALQPQIGGSLTSSSFGALTRIAGSFRFQLATGAIGTVQLLNTGTAAFTITLDTSNGVRLRTANGVTTLATGGSLIAGTIHVVAFDITIGASAAYAVYLDGVSLFSGTGNTANSQASVSTILLATNTASTTFDDLCLFNPGHAAYDSSVLTSNVVVETQFPTGDNQTLFTNDGNVVWPAGIGANGVYRATAALAAPGTNQLMLVKVTPQVNCTLNSVSIVPATTNGSAKFKAVAYVDSAGSPGSLLSSGVEIIGCTSDVTLSGTLVTPQLLTAGTSYWIGFIQDTSITYRQVDSTSNLGQRKSNTYTSGAPDPAGTMISGQPTFFIWGNCTGAVANWETVGMNPPLGTSAAQIHSSTIGNEDLYTFPAMVTTPTAIYGIAVKGFLSKSDSGTRTISLNMKSGATDSTGSNPGQSLSTTSQWQGSIFDNDPATGTAWTTSGVNNAKSGASVTS